jgi:hypothetical protein
MGGRVRAVTVCAYAAAALAVAVPLVGGLARDGYDHTAQFISELGERGTPDGRLVSLVGFIPIGVLVLVFAALALRDVRPQRLLAIGIGLVGVSVAIGYVVSGVARCEPGCPTDGDTQQAIHNAVGYVEYGGAPLGLLLAGLGARRLPSWRPVTVWAFVAVPLFLVLAPLLEEDSWRDSRGVLQRILEAAIFGWIALVGHRLRRAPAG